MLFNGNNIKKTISSVLLVTLLLIHSIKLLHTHASNSSFANHDCKSNELNKNDNFKFAKSSPDCSICSYQLNKDADDLEYPVFCIRGSEQKDHNTRLISFQKLTFHRAFETRGPPAAIA